jgi:hypothetical protein
MNQMYAMSVDIHLFSVLALMIIMLVMMLLHTSKNDLGLLVTKIQGVTIVYLCFLGFAVLTGAIMMAAQHLSFTPANLLMVLAAFAVLILEIKRNKALVKTIKYMQMSPKTYKRIAFRYYLGTFVLFLGVGAFAAMAA